MKQSEPPLMASHAFTTILLSSTHFQGGTEPTDSLLQIQTVINQVLSYLILTNASMFWHNEVSKCLCLCTFVKAEKHGLVLVAFPQSASCCHGNPLIFRCFP